ncbi:MAG: hypothetical protein KC933_08865 [Myxococcales bacterium]|nr:hypothetical protein [Myxococcales bacterium]
MSIRDILDQTDDEAGVPQTVRSGRLQAGFADLSAVTSTPAQVMPLGPSCFGLISLPVKSGQSEPLTMAEIRVEGTARGSVLASQASPGTYVAVGDPLLGADALRFLGTADPSTPFPGFDEALPALRSDVMLSVPAADGTAALTVDAFPVRWTPAGADWVEITLEPKSDQVEDGGLVVCQVKDEGCFDVPVAATNFLLAGNAETYTLSVQLHRYRGVEPEAGAFLEVEAVAETRLTVDNGVFE